MNARFAIWLAATVLVAGCSGERADTSASRAFGWQLKLGNGTVSSYAELDKGGTPAAIGVVWSTNALEGLPTGSDHHRCFGRAKDGEIDAATQCQHTHEFVIPLPDVVARRKSGCPSSYSGPGSVRRAEKSFRKTYVPS